MPALETRPTAIADLLAIVDYIAEDNPDAAHIERLLTFDTSDVAV